MNSNPYKNCLLLCDEQIYFLWQGVKLAPEAVPAEKTNLKLFVLLYSSSTKSFKSLSNSRNIKDSFHFSVPTFLVSGLYSQFHK